MVVVSKLTSVLVLFFFERHTTYILTGYNGVNPGILYFASFSFSFYVNLNVLTLSFVVEQHPVLVLRPVGCANVAKGCPRLLTFLLGAISPGCV